MEHKQVFNGDIKADRTLTSLETFQKAIPEPWVPDGKDALIPG